MCVATYVCTHTYVCVCVCVCVCEYSVYIDTGAGCIMESLLLRKPLIVVINEELMNNHQTELARQLSQDGHLLHTTTRYCILHYLLYFSARVIASYIFGHLSCISILKVAKSSSFIWSLCIVPFY